MQRRDRRQSPDRKAREQGWPESEDAKPSQIDHEAEDSGETSAFEMAEPGRIDLHHAWRAKGLEVAIHTANRDEQSEQPRERSRAE